MVMVMDTLLNWLMRWGKKSEEVQTGDVDADADEQLDGDGDGLQDGDVDGYLAQLADDVGQKVRGSTNW